MKTKNKKEIKSDTLEINFIKCCVRCEKEHRLLVFKKLAHPCLNYNYWCSCPNNGEPILLAIQENE